MHIRVLREQIRDAHAQYAVNPRDICVSSVSPGPPTCGWDGGSSMCSSNKLADTTGGTDASLSDGGELLGADDAWDLGELTLAEDLEVAL